MCVLLWLFLFQDDSFRANCLTQIVWPFLESVEGVSPTVRSRNPKSPKWNKMKLMHVQIDLWHKLSVKVDSCQKNLIYDLVTERRLKQQDHPKPNEWSELIWAARPHVTKLAVATFIQHHLNRNCHGKPAESKIHQLFDSTCFCCR